MDYSRSNLDINLSDFAKTLFGSMYPPESNSIQLNHWELQESGNDSDDVNFTNLVNRIFWLGYSHKFGKDYSLENFETARLYIRALGVDAILTESFTNKETGDLIGVSVQFIPYYENNTPVLTGVF